jgi:hypothetical protein
VVFLAIFYEEDDIMGEMKWKYITNEMHSAITKEITNLFLVSTFFIRPIILSKPGIALYSIFFRVRPVFLSFSL